MPIPALVLAAGAKGLFDIFGNASKSASEAESAYGSALEQWNLGREQDILGARTKDEQLRYLQGLPPLEYGTFTRPDEDVYRRTAELGLTDIREQGMRNLLGQQEAMAARGLGESSLDIGASQRLGQRTMREISGLEAEYAQQQSQRQAQYDALVAENKYRVDTANREMETNIANYMGPSEEEVAASWGKSQPKEETYMKGNWLQNIIPGGKGYLGKKIGKEHSLGYLAKGGAKGYWGKKKGFDWL